MRLGLVAFLLTLSLLPTVTAQVPALPAPDDAILLACDVAGGVEPQARSLLPCPQEDPAAPAAHDHTAAPSAPGAPDPSPEDAVRLADQVKSRVEEIPDEPASAPEKLMEIVLLVVDFVKGLLAVPADAFAAVHDALADVRSAIDSAKEMVTDAAKGAASQVIDSIMSLLDKPHAAAKVAAEGAIKAPARLPDVQLPLTALPGVVADAA